MRLRIHSLAEIKEKTRPGGVGSQGYCSCRTFASNRRIPSTSITRESSPFYSVAKGFKPQLLVTTRCRAIRRTEEVHERSARLARAMKVAARSRTASTSDLNAKSAQQLQSSHLKDDSRRDRRQCSSVQDGHYLA